MAGGGLPGNGGVGGSRMEVKGECLSEERAGGLRLSAMAESLALDCLAAPPRDLEISTGFVSDVPSDVLAGAPQGCVLVTSQSSLNVIAVATHTGIAGVIVTSGRVPSDDVLAKARQERIGLYVTAAQSFDVVGKLAGLGLRGPRRIFS